MIFVTVGTQLGFPRLIQMVDELAEQLGLGVVAQIGNTTYVPQNVEYHPSMTPEVYDACFEKADLIIGHAGIGTILAAKKMKKPLIILPRLAIMGEHRNDHQLATADAVNGVVGVYRVSDKEQMLLLLKRRTELLPAGENASVSRDMLIDSLRAFFVAC
ncbi:Uncharacterised protein [Zhongshania aliphaticivorans]|uniref:Glycosyl transferase family 28 C-terminal domain-containing protein n=1 Tax=Zhongshania aliphaticivorans TaxID=1470434 RepID=A0A5S9PPE5_9GAMM|nr:glycosyltransferase [Zhongshania aliphaticivorans]CAA0105584.1 Uncharacterised protein [Zhongshania aliphaticivorans]CAA0105864.1 Uncharacterised protein [Zhongshania aliphaticivorans]